MDLKEQKYVCALAEYKSLTKAAEKLYISQPALSIYISNVEKNLGTPLFERNGKRMILTYAGEKYVEKAKAMLRLEMEFREELNDIIAEHAGRIRIGVPLRRSPWLIAPVVAKFKSIYPNIEVIVRDGNQAFLNDRLKNFDLDMMIGNKTHIGDDMDTALLFQEEFLLAVPAFSPLNEKSQYVPNEKYRRIKPEFLSGQVLLLHTSWQSSRAIEDKIIRNHSIKPSAVYVMRNSETILQMVAEGLGVGFIREGYTIHMHYDKPLNYYTLNTEDHRSDVVVAYKKRKKLPKYMQVMIQLIKEQTGKMMQ